MLVVPLLSSLPPVFAIALLGLSLVAFLSKFSDPSTVISACLCAFSGMTESGSCIFLAFIYYNKIDKIDINSMITFSLIAFASVINLIFNIINGHLLRKYLFKDHYFSKNSLALTKFGTCKFYIVILISFILSHKWS